MGNPLSILLATSLCIASCYGTCHSEEKNEADCESIVDPISCIKADPNCHWLNDGTCLRESWAGDCDRWSEPLPCDADELCSWSIPTEVEAARARAEVEAARRARAGAAKTPKIAKSLTSVRHEGGRLKKDLPPIEAVTEMIGDYVVYKMLMDHMPDEYGEVLSVMNIDAMSEMNSVKASDYKPLGQTLLKQCVEESSLSMKTATDSERASKENPMQSVLRYSRPYLPKVESFLTDEKQKKITMDDYTLTALIATIFTVFSDNYIGNTDRYIGVSSEIVRKGILGINYNNIMLYNLDDKWVYVPIDQGFARTVTFTWFKTLGMSATNHECDPMLRKARVSEKDISERAYKQLLFSDRWLSGKSEYRSKAGKWWNRVYGYWLKDTDKAQHFVNDNRLLFPSEIYETENKHLKEQIIEIVNVVWNVMGPVLCDQLNEEIKGSFDKIHKKSTWRTTKAGRSIVLPLLPKKVAQKKFETQWDFVIEAMGTQAQHCAEWSKKIGEREEWEKQWIAIKEQLSRRPLLKDFLSKGATVSERERERQYLEAMRQQYQEAMRHHMDALAGRASFSEYSYSSSAPLVSVAHTVPYGDDFHLNMYSNDDPRIKPPYPSSHSDHDVKQPRYLWMVLMATVIVCGCFAIYSLWCIVNSVLCGILCYAKLLSSSPLWPWSTEQRVVCADEDFTSAV